LLIVVVVETPVRDVSDVDLAGRFVAEGGGLVCAMEAVIPAHAASRTRQAFLGIVLIM
jgi:hypothetical protein